MNGSTSQCPEAVGDCPCYEGYDGLKCNSCSEGYERQDEGGKCLVIPSCPDEWEGFQGKCYKIGQGKVTFEFAKLECSKLGGYMVELLDNEEENAIKELNKKYDQKHYWIGLTTKDSK